MLKIASLVSLLALLAGCADDSCSRAICGCWKNHTFREVILVTDSASLPLSGMTLFCETSQQSVGITGSSGTTRVRVKGRTSPGCGLTTDCEETTLRSATGEVVGTVNMALLLRGDRVAVGEYTVNVIRDSN